MVVIQIKLKLFCMISDFHTAYFLRFLLHPLMLIKSVVTAGICKQIKRWNLLFPQILDCFLEQLLAYALSSIGTANGKKCKFPHIGRAAAQKLPVNGLYFNKNPGCRPPLTGAEQIEHCNPLFDAQGWWTTMDWNILGMIMPAGISFTIATCV